MGCGRQHFIVITVALGGGLLFEELSGSSSTRGERTLHMHMSRNKSLDQTALIYEAVEEQLRWHIVRCHWRNRQWALHIKLITKKEIMQNIPDYIANKLLKQRVCICLQSNVGNRTGFSWNPVEKQHLHVALVRAFSQLCLLK